MTDSTVGSVRLYRVKLRDRASRKNVIGRVVVAARDIEAARGLASLWARESRYFAADISLGDISRAASVGDAPFVGKV